MERKSSVGLLSSDPIGIDVPVMPAPTPEWVIKILISGANGTIPQGPPTGLVKISLCEDGAARGDLWAGSVPGIPLEAQSFSVTTMEPSTEIFEFDLTTQLTVGEIYWIVLEPVGSIPPATDPAWRLWDISPAGGDPAIYGLLWDGSDWFDLTGQTSFILTGTNLPPGANTWGGSNNGISVVFGHAGGQKFAEKFTA